MKKTVTRPDGTTEVLEGTPEEIAAHERLIREEPKKRTEKKPDVLKGLEQSDFAQILKDWLEEQKKIEPVPYSPWWPSTGPIWIASCSRCHMIPCSCTWYDLTPQITCHA